MPIDPACKTQDTDRQSPAQESAIISKVEYMRYTNFCEFLWNTRPTSSYLILRMANQLTEMLNWYPVGYRFSQEHQSLGDQFNGNARVVTCTSGGSKY